MNENLTEKEIDEFVIAQAENDGAWERPIRVNRKAAISLDSVNASQIISVSRGEPVFRGTSVPVSVLLDNLEKGVSLDEFLNNFPAVSREDAVKVLEMFRSALSQLRVA